MKSKPPDSAWPSGPKQTLKASSVAAVIGYVELTKTGLLIRETTGSSFTVLCAIAAVYFTINYSISLGGAALERKFAYVH